MKVPHFFGGMMIISATIIGAGMLAIPIATSGIWFLGAGFVLLASCLTMMTSGLFVFEVSLNFPIGVGYNSMIKKLLGKNWNMVAGFCIVFVLYTLIYAYITVGSALTLDKVRVFIVQSSLNRAVITILFASFFAVFIWISTKAVDRFSTFLIFFLVMSFILLVCKTLPNIQMDNLLNLDKTNGYKIYWKYLPFAFPVCLASFGFHGNIPGLVKYFKKDVKKVKLSIIGGSLLALGIYLLWIIAIQGNIPRDRFATIKLGQEDEVVTMINILSQSIGDDSFKNIIQFFSYLALTSSFLGVALGLFEYFLDFFSLPDNAKGRLISGLITFIPPTIASLLFPYGFIYAMDYVGFAAAIWAVIIPALLVKKSRNVFDQIKYHVKGRNLLIYWVIIFGLMNLFSMILIQTHLVKNYISSRKPDIYFISGS